jgi:hypothetical protein
MMAVVTEVKEIGKSEYRDILRDLYGQIMKTSWTFELFSQVEGMEGEK